MTEDEVKAIFLLAGIHAEKLYKIANKYDGQMDYPWWLVKTKWGMIEIGWRKRVINIDWSDTPLRIKKNAIREFEFHMLPITNSDVTHEETYVHAWSYGAAVDYLAEFKRRMGNWEYATSPEGIIDLEERKKKYEEKQEQIARASVATSDEAAWKQVPKIPRV